MQDLALEIVTFNPVEICNAERPNSGGSKVQRSGAAEPSGPDHQNP
jgi:hypothetical protein